MAIVTDDYSIVLAGSPYKGGLGSTGPCGLNGLGRCSQDVTFVDHCHFHGLIRGELCNRHNQLAGVRGRPADETELEAIRQWELRCPACAMDSTAYYKHLARKRRLTTGHPGH